MIVVLLPLTLWRPDDDTICRSRMLVIIRILCLLGTLLLLFQSNCRRRLLLLLLLLHSSGSHYLFGAIGLPPSSELKGNTAPSKILAMRDSKNKFWLTRTYYRQQQFAFAFGGNLCSPLNAPNCLFYLVARINHSSRRRITVNWRSQEKTDFVFGVVTQWFDINTNVLHSPTEASV